MKVRKYTTGHEGVILNNLLNVDLFADCGNVDIIF